MLIIHYEFAIFRMKYNEQHILHANVHTNRSIFSVLVMAAKERKQERSKFLFMPSARHDTRVERTK